MIGRFSIAVSFGLMVCCAAGVLGQAGAPTQRVHIPGIPDGTSLYKPVSRADNFTSIGCVSKTPDGEFRITDWRGAAQSNGAGAPEFQETAPLVLRLQGDKEMLNFQVGHEVEIRGTIVEDAKGVEDTKGTADGKVVQDAKGYRPAELKADSILYLSRTCWKRGTNTPESAQRKP